MSATLAFSQKDNFWQKQSLASSSKVKADKANLPKSQVFSLNMNAFKQALIQAPKRENVYFTLIIGAYTTITGWRTEIIEHIIDVKTLNIPPRVSL